MDPPQYAAIYLQDRGNGVNTEGVANARKTEYGEP